MASERHAPDQVLISHSAGKSLTDYAGRTYMHVPTDKGISLSADSPAPDSFIPKECIHTFTGHTKGISSMKIFPGSGHLLLSGSMDSKVKVSRFVSSVPDLAEASCLQFENELTSVRYIACSGSCGTSTTRATACVRLWVTRRRSRMSRSTTTEHASLPPVTTGR